MQVQLNADGYVTGYALIGNIEGGIEIADPADEGHFEQHFSAYRVRDGSMQFDEEHDTALMLEQTRNDYRQRRETECFTVINRGQLWYEGITVPQMLELRKWYKAWLNVTDTMVVPEKPTWLT